MLRAGNTMSEFKTHARPGRLSEPYIYSGDTKKGLHSIPDGLVFILQNEIYKNGQRCLTQLPPITPARITI